METNEERNNVLNIEVNSKKIRDMSAHEFCQFCLSKMNETKAFEHDIIDLTKTLMTYNIKVNKNIMSDDLKIDIIEKLKRAGLY